MGTCGSPCVRFVFFIGLTLLEKGKIACNKNEARGDSPLREGRLASRAFREMRPFDEAKSISGNQTL